MKKGLLLVGLAMLSMLVVCRQSQAGTVTAVGTPYQTHSWAQQWYDSDTVVTMIQIEAVPGTGTVLETTAGGLSNVSPGGTLTINTSTEAQFDFSSPNYGGAFYFTTNFTSPEVAGTAIYYQSFNGNSANADDTGELMYLPDASFISTAGYSNQGSGWGWIPLGVQQIPLVEQQPVPEPASMIFFGTGLVAIGGYLARRRTQRS